MSYTVTFNEFNLTEYFSVESVTRSVLPPRDIQTITVPQRHGAYFTGATYGVREIDINVIVKASTPTDYMNTIRTLAFCLDFPEPTELIISDEPDKMYYAILSDQTNINELLSIGTGKLTFLCPDPFAYSIDKKSVTPNNNLFTIDNEGTTTTYPKFTVNFQKDASFVSLTSPDGVILVGTPNEVDKVTLPPTQYILNDPMQTVTGWNNAGAILDEGRHNVGSVVLDSTTNEDLMANDYGTGTDKAGIWHGPAVRKDLSEPVQDFTTKIRMHMSSQDGTSALDGNQKGRIEIYMFDVNGGKIGKFVMRDSFTNYEFNIPEVWIGENDFLNQTPTAPSGTKVTQKEYTTHKVTSSETLQSIADKYKVNISTLRSLNGLSSSTKTVPTGTTLKLTSKTITKTVYPEHVGNYNDFFGEFTLQRVGTTWYAEVCRMDSSFNKSNVISKTFYDKSKKYSQNEVAYIVINFLQYDIDPVCQVMNVSDVKVIKHNTNTTIDIPQIFQAGDVLEIDLSDSSVLLNGDFTIMNHVDVASTFFPIYEGTTQVKINSDDTSATYTATYTERYL